jgi:hypothetical protein
MDTKFLYLIGKDIETITGLSDRQGRRELVKVRKYFKKGEHCRVTVIDYSIYADMPLRQIFHLLNRKITDTELAELEVLREKAKEEWEKKKREDRGEG